MGQDLPRLGWALATELLPSIEFARNFCINQGKFFGDVAVYLLRLVVYLPGNKAREAFGRVSI